MVTSKALSIFDNLNQLTPYAVGFDRVFDQLQNYVQHNATSTGFPPYNIRKGGDYNFAIEMALAGFSKDDIEIEISTPTHNFFLERHSFFNYAFCLIFASDNTGVDLGVEVKE